MFKKQIILYFVSVPQ